MVELGEDGPGEDLLSPETRLRDDDLGQVKHRGTFESQGEWTQTDSRDG